MLTATENAVTLTDTEAMNLAARKPDVITYLAFYK